MKTLLMIVLALLLSVIGMGLILPNDFKLERKVTINAPAEQIYPLLNDLHQWPSWSPWQKMDPSVVIEVGQPSSGVGANQRWQDDHGGGRLTLIHSSVEDGIAYQIWFADASQPSEASMTLEPQPNGTTVVRWQMSGRFELPIIGPYMAINADSMIGPAFEQGLAGLKLAAE